MSWRCLQAGEAVSWDPTSSGGPPPALSRLIPTAKTCCSPASETDTCHCSRSGMTCGPSTGSPGVVQLTLSLVDSPAKTSALRVAVRDLPASVRDSGTRCSESLARSGLDLSSRRTARTCVPVDLAPSSKDLPAWGMTHGGACWELGTSARHTSETECGSWLPTPSASSYGYNQGGSAGRVGKRRYSLDSLAKLDGLDPLPLREWMMGWPQGWTALEPLEMAKFQQWQHSHGLYSARD